MKMKTEVQSYEAPMVEVFEVEVEKGFAQSPGLEDLEKDEEQGWGN